MSRDDYLAALKIAEKHVQRKKALQSANLAGALSGSLARELMGRFYQVGDTWDVAAVHVASNMMRMTDDPAQLRDRAEDVGIFRYKVTKIERGAEPTVTIEISQLEEQGLKPVDSRVEKLVLKVNEKMDQTARSYVMRGRAAVNTGPLTSSMTANPIDLFPLDVPNIVSAERESERALPQLPPALQRVAGTPAVATGRSAWFEQDDFFGRPVQFLWQQGDPWPTYLKTSQGVAVLIRKGDSR
jgi:hypothetical protein